jgi:O-methyltransferase
MKLTYLKSQATFAIARILNAPFYWLGQLTKTGYQIIVPGATYAPWHNDTLFLKTFKEAKKNSLINFYQAWELWQLAAQFEKLEGDILEVGVWRGSTSAIMATKLKSLGSKKTIYACDTFAGVVKSNPAYDNYYKDGEHKDTSLAFVDNLLKTKFGLDNVTLLQGIFPDDTQHLVSDKKFCFCHIDVDTYDSAVAVINWLWPRLSIGGAIVCSDFGFPMTQGITRAVNENIPLHGKTVIQNINGNGIIIKTA